MNSKGFCVGKYDLLVLGSGPAGATAAIYALREGLKVLLIEKEAVGGKLNTISSIQNYPGYTDISGVELASKLKEQLASLNADIVQDNVIKIKQKDGKFHVFLEKKSYIVPSVIIATGTRDMKLGVTGETELLGRGVSYCSLCDGPFFRNKVVAVIGAGDRAYSEAIYLSSIAKKVYIIQRGLSRADKFNTDKANKINNITIIQNSPIVSINGEKRVESITTSNKEKTSQTTIEVQGVFPLVGNRPNTDMLDAFPVLSEKGFIVVNQQMETTFKGLFACGDVLFKDIRQITTAVGEGAIAGTMAARYIKG